MPADAGTAADAGILPDARILPAGILLAAGAGSRFGGGKLLHRLPDGESIGLRAWRNLCAALEHVTVVVRAGDHDVENLFREAGAVVTICPDAHLGMGHSLACAVRATREARGWIIALADMPCVEPATIRGLASQLAAGADIVVPVHQGQRGHPVGIAARFGEDLMGLTGDAGARALLRDNAEAIVRIEVADAGVLQDVDTREDARHLVTFTERAPR